LFAGSKARRWDDAAQLAVGVQLDEAVESLAVLGEQEAVLDGIRGRGSGGDPQ
jgi:hypothetical protein